MQPDKHLMQGHAYTESEQFLTRAEKVIPLGSQTFSKSRVHFPLGASPLFASLGKGAYLWDIDGNHFIDFLSGLLSISLGYGDPDVDEAVQKQMSRGVTFSLPHKVETELAERLVELIPCAEQVRFGKNGSDVTSAAIRLARACTGRDHLAVCGYHGWQDWYIGSTTRDKGVPDVTRQLTHTFEYNNPQSLQALFDQYPGELAAVILEPMTFYYPEMKFLQQVKNITHQHGAVLIFDEMITGFRFDMGGAQACFGVTPDLATFGKGMANGYPLSAIVGRRDIMQLMEDIFYSSTFGGETLSITAALATINKLERESVLSSLAASGKKILHELGRMIAGLKNSSAFAIAGHPAWTLLSLHGDDNTSAMELKTLFMQEMLIRGVLIQSTHNLTYSHGQEEINRLLAVYAEVLPFLDDALTRGRVQQCLKTKPLTPLFNVRNQ